MSPDSPEDTQNNGNSIFKLRHSLRGHEGVIRSIAWSPRGDMLASGSEDNTIRLWDAQSGKHLRTLTGHSRYVHSMVWSPDGSVLASGSADETIRLWDAQSGKHLRTFRGHSSWVYSVAWSPDGSVLASSSSDKTIRLWDVQSGKRLRTLTGHSGYVDSVSWSPGGEMLASGSTDDTIRLWDAQSGHHLRTLEGHSAGVVNVAWSPSDAKLVSCSEDQTIRLWEPTTGQLIRILEGHTSSVNGISFSKDGLLLASVSQDGEVRIWRTDEWQTVAIRNSSGDHVTWFVGFAFHPNAPVLATSNEVQRAIYIWDLDLTTIMGKPPATSSVHYTTAKIALVGDSGVGKTGLGYRIAEDRFLMTKSTHGQQFWVVGKLGKTRNDGTLCETVLWDFAGQANFRPIHGLFLDDVDLALVLFDPSRMDTFTGVDYWLKQLSHHGQMCRSVLVAARSDVSTLPTSPAELDAFCRERNISGGFIATSAMTSEGVDELLERMRQQIDWDAKPTTTTTETFKRIKEYVLTLKVDADHQHILVRPGQLRALLEATDPTWNFSDAEMMGAVGHLQNHGYVTILRRSSNEQNILLAPDVLINLAASYMLKAQANEKGLGALEESRVLSNEYDFPQVEHLSEDERTILLKSAMELFLTRNVCFRETIDGQTFLIFPSLIHERPPRLIEETEQVEDMTYVVSGPVENVYPALVVLLGYAPSFQRTNQWRKQAQYETMYGKICGFKLVNDDPGELELVLYYDTSTPEFVRSRFQGLFEEILYTRKVDVSKYAPLFCSTCNHQQERRTVIRRTKEGKIFLFCDECGEKMSLPKIARSIPLSTEDRTFVVRNTALTKLRTTYEAALVSVKSFLGNRGDMVTPTCFVSYAWGNRAHERWVEGLADDLQNADIEVVLDQWGNAEIGASVPRFISRIEQCDFIVAIGTPSYRQKYENKLSTYGKVAAAEVDSMNVRLTGTEEQKASILPLLVAGEAGTAFPPLLQGRVYGNFTREEEYFIALYDLVLTLHRIQFDHPLVRDLRAKLREEVEMFTRAQ
jgi:small GTP-binding protein